jgi:hypothetical protein
MSYLFITNLFHVLFVHNKSVTKRKVCFIYFHKKFKYCKTQQNPFLVGFWVVFLLATLPGPGPPGCTAGSCVRLCSSS